MTTDRDALINAANEAAQARRWIMEPSVVVAMVDAVLPLIVEAIEDWRAKSERQAESMTSAEYHLAASIALGHANAARLIANLVRSLARPGTGE